MKFKYEQKDLVKALTVVLPAVPSRTPLPILAGVKIETDEDRIVLTATDNVITIKKSIPAVIEEDGVSVVSAKLMHDIVRKLPSGEINAKQLKRGMKFAVGKSQFTVTSFDANEYPKMGTSTAKQEITVNSVIFAEMLRGVVGAASEEVGKGIITGVLTQIEDNEIYAVALDDYRMAIRKGSISYDGNHEFVVAATTLREVMKIASEYDGDIVISHAEKQTTFIMGDASVSCRLMEGVFVKYRDIIPKDYGIRVKVNKAELEQAIDRALVFSLNGKNNLIRCEIGDGLTVSSQSQTGETEDKIEIEKEGGDLEIGFNGKYMLDTLKVIEDEEVIMKFKDNLTGCLIVPPEGKAYAYLVLPVRMAAKQTYEE